MKHKNTLSKALREDRGENINYKSASVEDKKDRKRVVNFRLDQEVLQRLKLLALQEESSMQALVCEGLNKVLADRGLPPIAK